MAYIQGGSESHKLFLGYANGMLNAIRTEDESRCIAANILHFDDN